MLFWHGILPLISRGQMTYSILLAISGEQRNPCSLSHHTGRANPHSRSPGLHLSLRSWKKMDPVSGMQAKSGGQVLPTRPVRPSCFLPGYLPPVWCLNPQCGCWGSQPWSSIPRTTVCQRMKSASVSTCLLGQVPSPCPTVRGIRCHWKWGTPYSSSNPFPDSETKHRDAEPGKNSSKERPKLFLPFKSAMHGFPILFLLQISSKQHNVLCKTTQCLANLLSSSVSLPSPCPPSPLSSPPPPFPLLLFSLASPFLFLFSSFLHLLFLPFYHFAMYLRISSSRQENLLFIMCLLKKRAFPTSHFSTQYSEH